MSSPYATSVETSLELLRLCFNNFYKVKGLSPALRMPESKAETQSNPKLKNPLHSKHFALRCLIKHRDNSASLCPITKTRKATGYVIE